MGASTTPSPLEIPHIILQTLSYASPQTLGRCMAVSTAWYDAAATFLWAHVSYRVNPYLKDPGVTPFLRVPPGDQTRGLRRAKRRAVRHVRVVEMRKHECGEVGCENMTLHGEESEDEGEVASCATSLADLELGEPGHVSSSTAAGLLFDGRQPAQSQARVVLTSLRLHIDDNHRTMIPVEERTRIIPYPCPFVSRLDTTTLVIVPLRHLSTARPVPLPSPPSLRKLVVLLIPPTHVPGEHRIADTIPSSVDEVVVYLWRRHASSAYDNFRGSWASQMGQKRWGPDKIWGHWCNLILSSSPLGFELPQDALTSGRTRTRRFTFVGTGGFDPLWLDLADSSKPVPQFPGQDLGADPAMYKPNQDRFEKGMRACLVAKAKERRMRYTGGSGEEIKDWEMQMKECLDNVRFLSRDEYLAEGRWQGEFTRDEVMYHG